MPIETTTNSVTPATLCHYTRGPLVVPQLRLRDTAGVISELSHALQRDGCVPDVLPFYHTALNRELLANSAVECGIALPHARLSGVKRLQFAFGRTLQPIMWGAKSPWPVDLIFLLAVPATDAVSYLHLLASLARLGHQRELLTELRQASDTEAILSVLERIRLRV
jgi:mannitol/fructose-specific phosphotransferase system IIA component (Ntr-type)